MNNSPMISIGVHRFRKLRIAWTAWWGSVAVLLCVVWVRSYWKKDTIYRTYANGSSHYFTSNNGVIHLSPWHRPLPLASLTNPTGWKLRSNEVDLKLGKFWGFWPSGELFSLPYFAPVLFSTALSGTALISWSWRFSLRTLLIATTLIAVLLGIAVYLLR